MRTLLKMGWLEMKLFAREPLTVVFAFALPLITLFVLGGVFGNTPDPRIYRGVGPMNFYTPAYIGLVLASAGLLALPVHLASYRERGVLRRFRASSVPLWTLLGAQVLVTVAMGIVGAVTITVASRLVYGVEFPISLAGVIGAFFLSAIAFSAIGVLLGSVLPTARAAQGAGTILFFTMFVLGGSGPPREVMTNVMRRIGDLLPLTHVVHVLQDPWLGFSWNGVEIAIVVGMLVAAATLSALTFRWE